MAAPVRTVTPEDRAHLEGYSPEIAPERWEAIRPFVLPLVLDYLPHTEARIWPILRHLVAYVDWCHHGHDVALERERLLDPDMIAYYIANVTGISKSSKTTRRALLLRVCDFLVPDMRRTVRMQPIGKEPASQPYTPAELKQLRMLAMEQPTPYLRHSAWVLLAFGLGAGLTAGEIAEVRREDVVEDRKGVYVVVRHSKRNQLRRVPVLDEFADEAIVLARCVLPGSWVFRSSRTTAGPGTVAAWASRLRTPEGVSFNLTRMRSTWIVRHLNAGVPVTAVLAAAGMGTFTGLDRYTPYLTQLSADEVRELVGRETNARAAATQARAMTHPGKREAKRLAERDYYAKNRERVRARQREHYAKNRERILARERQRYAERKRAQFEGLVS